MLHGVGHTSKNTKESKVTTITINILAATTTNVTDGTDPTAAPTLAPGGAATVLDNFNVATSTGTDTVTAVQVTLAAGTSAGLSLVEIINGAGTVLGSVSNPATDVVNISLTTNINATTTSTPYRVRITPKSHAAMPAPPGSTYTVTGTVTDITCTNTKNVNDTDSDTVTIDNASPGNATWGTITPGNAQVTLNWTNPGDADFSQVVILRRAVAAVADNPTEGATYVQGNTIGTSTVRYVGSLATFIDTGLTNSTDYYYEIFAKDSRGNYATGTPTGPHPPNSTTTVADDNGNAPAATTVAPGATTNLDAFSVVTDTGGGATVSGLTVTTANTGAIASMRIWNLAKSTQYFGTVSAPGGNNWVFSGGTPISATTSAASYLVEIIFKDHPTLTTDMGTSTYGVTGAVTAVTTTDSVTSITDNSNIITVDNAPPGDASWTSATPGNGQVALVWTNPADADFNSVVILRSTASISDAPTDGSTYSASDTIGSSTVVYVGSGTSFTDTGLTNGTAVYYKIFARDTYINYAAGTQIGPRTPNSTTTVADDNGNDPAATTVAPGATNNLDAFSVVTDTGGGATVSGLTVTTANTGAIASMRIWNLAKSTQYFGTVSAPSGNNWTFSGGTPISATTSAASYLVEIIFKDHPTLTTDMGTSTYGVTGAVTAVTTTDSVTSITDDSNTITVDNAPPANVTGVSATAGNTQVTLDWTNPGADFFRVLVVRRANSAVSFSPTDGTAYTQGGSSGPNDFIYVGNLETFLDSGLSNGTTYHYEIFAYDSYLNYASGVTTSATPTAAATAPTVTTPTAVSLGTTTATLGANVTSDGGAALTVKGIVWNTTGTPTTADNVVTHGTTATGVFTVNATALTAETQIFYRGYATNGIGTSYSSEGSFYPEPVTQASGVNFTGVSSSGMTVNWTGGSGDGVLVLVHKAAAVDSNPVDGTYASYTADSSEPFGGTELGTGNFVVYKGTGTSVALTGLAASTTYHVAVYEVNGLLDTTGDADAANYKLIPATGSQATTAAVSCAAAAPTVNIAPNAQFVAPGDSIIYTVTVTNNDSGGSCTDTTFNLSASDDDADNSDFVDPPTVDSPLVIAPGANGTATLTVTAQSSGTTEGNSTIVTVSVTDAAGSPPAAHVGPFTDTVTATIQSYNPMIHSSASTGSSYWGSNWGVTSGSQYGKFECATCHDYQTTNIKRVKTLIKFPNSAIMPSGTVNTAVVLLDARNGSSDFGDDSAAGRPLGLDKSDRVCEVCHTLTSYHRYDSTGQTNTTHANKSDCVSCHPHNQGFKALDCFACHGGGTTGSVTRNYWPDDSTTDTFNDEGRHKEHMDLLSIARYTVNATVLLDDADADSKQKALCAYCHAVNDDDHATGDVAEVFTADIGGTPTTVAKTYWDTTDQAPVAIFASAGNGTCSNVDCHNSKLTTDATFGWYAAGTSTCTMCHTPGGHANEIANGNPTSGLHTGTLTISNNPHDDSFDDGNSGTADCETCHTGSPSSTHWNGSVTATDITIHNAITFVDGTPETCAVGGSLGSCHDDGGAWARRWSTTAKNIDGTECVNCHSAYTDKTAPVASGTFSAVSGVSKRHDAYNAAIFDNHGGADNGGCYQCHGYSPANTTYYDLSSLHRNGTIELNNQNTFTDNGDGTVGCAACHSANDGTSAHAFDDTYNGDADGFARWDRDVTTVTGPAGGCNACHGTTVSGNPQYWPDGTGSGYQDSNAGAHDNHVMALADHLYAMSTLDELRGDADTDTKQKAICAWCHPDPGGSGHNANGGSDSRVDLNAAGSFLTYNGVGLSKTDTSSNAYTYGTDTQGTCNNLACHNRQTTPDFWNASTQPTATCAICHPQTSFESDAHNYHVGTNAWKNHNCTECHEKNDTTGSFPTATQDVDHADGLVDLIFNDASSFEATVASDTNPISYSIASPKYDDGLYGTCSSVDCHNNQLTPAWNAAQVSPNCTICHTAGGSANDPTRGLHSGTLTVTGKNHDESFTYDTDGNGTFDGTADCVTCHTSQPTQTDTDHINGTFSSSYNSVASVINFAAAVGYTDANPGTCMPTGALSTCHSSGAEGERNGGNGWKRRWSTTARNTDGTECANCHGGFDGSWTFTSASVGDGNTDHDRNWDGDGNPSEVIGKHTGTTQQSRCFACHIYDDSDYYTKEGSPNHIGWVDNPAYNSVTRHGDGNLQMAGSLGYSRSGGDAWGCATTCHSSNTGHYFASGGTGDTSEWTLDIAAGKPVLSCVTCHDGNGSGALSVGPSSPHVVVGTATDYNAFTLNPANTGGLVGGCEACHPGGTQGLQHRKDGDADVVGILNSATLGISYTATTNGGDHDVDTTAGIKGGFFLGGDATVGSQTQADICWDCHSNTTYQSRIISEWEFNTDTNGPADDYDYGSIYTSLTGTTKAVDWTSNSTFWRSGKGRSSGDPFYYKRGAIQSTHTAQTTTPDGTEDAALSANTKGGYTETRNNKADINCAYCHDVHNTAAVNGKPFLRGTWKGNPYPEDGAPQSGMTDWTMAGGKDATDILGPVPRGSASPTNTGDAAWAKTGGYWIDQNSDNPNNGESQATTSGLCSLCHDTSDLNVKNDAAEWVSGFNGHNNVILGGSGRGGNGSAESEERNIFNRTWRGSGVILFGQPADNPMTDMGLLNVNASGLDSTVDRGYSFRGCGEGENMGLAPCAGNGTDSRPYAFNAFQWNDRFGRVNIATNSIQLQVADGSNTSKGSSPEPYDSTNDRPNYDAQANYHTFNCGKCHNPHASRLPKLMITNCLDTKQNTWDDDYGTYTDALSAQSAYEPTVWTNSKASQWPSAQNCHRLDDRAGTSETRGRGWNRITPW